MGIATLLTHQGRLCVHAVVRQPLITSCPQVSVRHLTLKKSSTILVHPPQNYTQLNRTFFSSLRHSVGKQAPRNATFAQKCAAPLRLSVKGAALGLFPFSLLKKHHEEKHAHELSPEILANIPKHVFKKDVLVKKKKGNIIKRFFMRLWHYLRVFVRFNRILFTFGPVFCAYPLTFISKSFTHLWWRMLLKACEWSGPTFIKLGQWASTRRDLFSPEFCDLFSKLHDCTRRHSWFYTKRKLKKAFGKRWREIFIKMDREPIGSGCIAQVHKAYMAADMIPDEALVEEFMDDSEDDDEPEVDLSEGIEIVGFGHVSDALIKEQEPPIPLRLKPKPEGQSSTQPIPDTPPRQTEEAGDDDEETDPEDPTAEGSTWVQTQPDPNEAADQNDDEFEEIPLIPVAVKVLHPGVFRLVSRDLQIIRSCARFAEFVFPSLRWLSLSESIDEFRQLLIKQIDLRFEAECLEQFVENFEDIPNVRFPTPIRPYCKRDVLVETFEEGVPITNFLTENEEEPFPEGLKSKLGEIGADALLKMVFVDDFVHGDMHPGNILVQNSEHFTLQDENKLIMVDLGDTVICSVHPVESPLRLILLDVGITASLSGQDLENFKAVFKAVVLGEGEVVADLMLRHSRSNDCKDVDAFKHELGEVVMQAREATISLGTLKVGQLLSDVFSVLSKHRVKMESNFASVLLAIFVLEGLGRSLDPDLDLLEKAKPVLLTGAMK